MELRSSREAAMADSRRRSSSGGRLSGWRSWSRVDRVANLKEGAVGLDVEEEERLWENRFLVGDLAGDLEVEKEVRGEEPEPEPGLSDSTGFLTFSFTFSCFCFCFSFGSWWCFSLSLSFLKMWASWTIEGGVRVFFRPLDFFFGESKDNEGGRNTEPEE